MKAGVAGVIVLVITLIGIGGGAFVENWELQQELTSMQNHLEGLQKHTQSLKSHIETLVKKGSLLEGENEILKRELEKLNQAMESEKSALNEERLKFEKERARLEVEKQKQFAIQEALEKQLHRLLENKDITISQLEGRLKVNVASKILFASSSAILLPEGKEVLNQIAKAVITTGDQEIRVEGHTDDVPISKTLSAMFPTNWELSTNRATSAVHYLQETCGFSANRLSASGYGDTHPIAPNDTEENRAKNRRIEILLVPIATTVTH